MSAALLMDLDYTTSPPEAEASGSGQYVTFTCGDRSYGLDIMAVREIRSWTPVTALPNQPSGAKGVLDIRGSIVQVFDLGQLLGGMGLDAGQRGQVVLVVSLGRRDVGLLVDSVSDIVFAEDADLRSPPDKHGPVSALINSDDRLVAVLELGRLFP